MDQLDDFDILAAGGDQPSSDGFDFAILEAGDLSDDKAQSSSGEASSSSNSTEESGTGFLIL